MKVLIAIEGSEYSMAALKSAAERNWNPDTEFNIVSAVSNSYAAASEGEEALDAHKKLIDDGRNFVEKKAAEFKAAVGSDKKVEPKVLIGSDPATAIIEEANNWKADLIIVGSHGRKGFQRLLLGSVAEKVANQASCSIEIVKGKVKA